MAIQLGNLNKEIEDIIKLGEQWVPSDLLICDEAHAFEDELVGYGTIEIKLDFISNILKDKPLHDEIEKAVNTKNYGLLFMCLEKAKKKIDELWNEKKTHSRCIKFLRSKKHINMHRNEVGCECNHKNVRSNCKECKKIQNYQAKNKHLLCTTCLHELGKKTKPIESSDELVECTETHDHFTSKWMQKIKRVRINLSGKSIDN